MVSKESIGIDNDLTKDRNMNTFKTYCKRRKSGARFPDRKANNRLCACHCIAGNASAESFSSRTNAAICRKGRTMSNSVVLKTIRWPTLAWCRRRQKLYCLWQLVQGQSPPALREKFPMSISSRTENIFRNLASLAASKCSNSLHLATLLPSAILLWNWLTPFTLSFSSSSLASFLKLLDFFAL